eukprot:1611073-Pyramimonas_sp.AAC.1
MQALRKTRTPNRTTRLFRHACTPRAINIPIFTRMGAGGTHGQAGDRGGSGGDGPAQVGCHFRRDGRQGRHQGVGAAQSRAAGEDPGPGERSPNVPLTFPLRSPNASRMLPERSPNVTRRTFPAE